mmetsp:Transcript_8258/g.10813  ORF Transcript_8258/g.10813 Transcript_8258/m.10813 type:complete len:98 (-) Transcript_8258:188-481(-)|eukprot:CAMPEP_0198152026 /NCGR_PEP_ID=MMETSP1443-20131203/58176_1 /TAXON_ID=186043 /ORGANISM="Entomoneis sp., Strain CCMP2396" /LENGTH=97 /DNA_ID=CAMNT_0043817905 /DNA_START=78 /DNA_END=371 /DNA_ORIENTATION=-
MLVLLCGRMPSLLNQLQGMLEQQGHSVVWVVSDKEAVEKLGGPDKFDAVWIAPPYSAGERKIINAALPKEMQPFQVLNCCPQDLFPAVASINAQMKA